MDDDDGEDEEDIVDVDHQQPLWAARFSLIMHTLSTAHRWTR